MADEEHCDTPVSKLAGRSEKLLDLVVRKRRGRLVHDQNFDIERNRLRDFNCLLRSQGEPLRSRPNIELHTQVGQYLFGLVMHVLPADELPLVAMSDENIFGHIQIREYQRLLIDRGDPACLRMLRVRQVDDRSGNPDFAFIRLFNSGDDLDQSGFASAVLADQRMDFTWAQIKRDLVQRSGHVEALGKIAHLKHGNGGGFRFPVSGLTAGFAHRIHSARPNLERQFKKAHHSEPDGTSIGLDSYSAIENLSNAHKLRSEACLVESPESQKPIKLLQRPVGSDCDQSSSRKRMRGARRPKSARERQWFYGTQDRPLREIQQA